VLHEKGKTMTAPKPRPRQSKQLDAGGFHAEISSFRLHLAAEGKACKTVRTYTEAVQWFAAAHLRRETGLTSWEQVGKQESITIGDSRTTEIGKNEQVTISDNRDETVGKNETVNIGENREVTVGKNDQLNVAKVLLITAGDEITLQAGSASIVMKSDGTIQINGKDITVSGSGKIGVKASGDMTLKGSKIAAN